MFPLSRWSLPEKESTHINKQSALYVLLYMYDAIIRLKQGEITDCQTFSGWIYSVKGGFMMVPLIVIICIFSFIGGILSESRKLKKMTWEERSQYNQKKKERAAGVVTGLLVGTAVAGRTILKNSDGGARKR